MPHRHLQHQRILHCLGKFGIALKNNPRPKTQFSFVGNSKKEKPRCISTVGFFKYQANFRLAYASIQLESVNHTNTKLFNFSFQIYISTLGNLSSLITILSIQARTLAQHISCTNLVTIIILVCWGGFG